MTGVGRTPEQINREIRALWPPGAVEPTCREAYQRLLVEWAEAMRAEQELAA